VSPGDPWFSLDVDGGFSLSHVEEDTPDDEAPGILERYVGLAGQYLLSAPAPMKTGRLGLPAIKLSTSEGDVLLRESLVGVVRRVLRINRCN
jgi:hypothetical protein